METRLSVKIDGRGARAEAGKLDRSLNKLEKSGNKTSGSLVKLRSRVGLLAGAMGGLVAVMGVRQLVKYADTWTEIGTRLRLVTSSSEELVDVQQKLFDVSQETRSSFESNAILFSRMSLATKKLGISQEDMLKVTKTLNQQILLGGSNAAEASAGLIQLSQGLAANRLQGDELRSVMENLLGVSGGLLEGFRRLREKGQIDFDVTRENIRDLAADGILSADLLLKALLEVANSTDEAFGGVALTVGQAVTVLDNSLGRLIGTADSVKGISGSLALTIVEFAAAIENFSAEEIEDALDAVGVAAKIVAAILIGRLGGALVLATRNQIALALASIRVAAGLNFVGPALVRTTVLARTAAVSVAGLNAAMAFLGGPAGVAILAASALAYYAFSADDAEESSKLLALSADDLKDSLKGLSEAKLKLNIQTLEGNVTTLKAARDELKELVDVGRKFGKNGGFIPEFRVPIADDEAIRKVAALEDAEADLAKAENTLLEVRKKLSGLKSAVEPEEVAKVSAEYTKQLAILERQLFLVGKTGSASKALYDSAIAVMKGELLPAEAKHLISLNKELDAKEALVEIEKDLASEREKAAEDAKSAIEDILSESVELTSSLQRQVDLYGVTGIAATIAYDNAQVSLKGLTDAQKEALKGTQAINLELAKQVDVAKGKEALETLEEELRTEEEALIASQERRIQMIISGTEKGSKKRSDLILKAEAKLAEELAAIDPMSKLAERAAENIQDAFADFLFDPFADGLEGMLDGFLKTIQRMVAEDLASKILGPGGLNIEGILQSGFGSTAAEKAGTITADAVSGAAETGTIATGAAALTGAATALTASGTASATALTTSATALTTSATTAATALTTTAIPPLVTAATALTTAAASLTAAATALAGAAATLASSGAGNAVKGILAGTGKASGGNVFSGRFNEVGEFNQPELLTQGGRSFLIPGNKGNVSPMSGGGGQTIVQNFSLPNITTAEEARRSRGEIARAASRGIDSARRYS